MQFSKLKIIITSNNKNYSKLTNGVTAQQRMCLFEMEKNQYSYYRQGLHSKIKAIEFF